MENPERAAPPVASPIVRRIMDSTSATAASGSPSPMNWVSPPSPSSPLYAKNRRADFSSLARLLRKFGCALIVVGNPLYMSGDISPQALKAQAFAQTLQQETNVAIQLWYERLSSTEAHRHLDAAERSGYRRDVIDQVAAVLILQSFLDSQR